MWEKEHFLKGHLNFFLGIYYTITNNSESLLYNMLRRVEQIISYNNQQGYVTHITVRVSFWRSV